MALLLLCAAHPELVLERRPQLVTILADLARTDEDRYVLGYALEALRSLADSGCHHARQALLGAILNVAEEAGDSHTLEKVQRILGTATGEATAEEQPLSLSQLVDVQFCPRTNATSPF